VRRLTSADRLSYFRGCLSNIPLGEYFTTAEIARKAGLPPDNQARDALKKLYELGEVDRLDASTRTGTRSYRWGRLPTEAEAHEAKAAAAASIEAAKAKYAAELDGVTSCRFVDCTAVAPVGQRYCDQHAPLMQPKETPVLKQRDPFAGNIVAVDDADYEAPPAADWWNQPPDPVVTDEYTWPTPSA
jgi:hypothetical protein